MMMRSAACLALALLALLSCGPAGTDQRLEAGWLEGSWRLDEGQNVFIESWALQDDSTLVGQGVTVSGGETALFETLRIERRHTGTLYIATVLGQNNDEPVAFRLTSSSDSELVFENPAHDFPQKIRYTLIAADSLVAEISGTADGKQQSLSYPMTRLQDR